MADLAFVSTGPRRAGGFRAGAEALDVVLQPKDGVARVAC